jgi:hypothetical protein
MQCLARDTTDVSGLQGEVTRAWGVVANVEATRAEAVHTMVASAQEATTMRERPEARRRRPRPS